MLDVLFIHAYPLDARMWDAQLAAAPADLRLHALDLPGFGRSTSDQLPSSVDVLAEAIHERTRAFSRFALCGLSMGGYATFAFWRRYGHEGRLAGLILADTKAEADTPEAKAGRDSTIQLIRTRGLTALAEQLVPRVCATDEAARQARALIASQRADAIVAATEALRDRPDSSELLPGMNLPVLVVGGGLDALTPPDVMQRLVARLPNAKWAPIPGAGHLANLDRPDAFHDAIFPFLRSL